MLRSSLTSRDWTQSTTNEDISHQHRQLETLRQLLRTKNKPLIDSFLRSSSMPDTHDDRRHRNVSRSNDEGAATSSAPLSVLIDGVTVPLTEDSLQALKVLVIKQITQSLGLKQTGKKSVLIDRILTYAESRDGRDFLGSVGLQLSVDEPMRGRRRVAQPPSVASQSSVATLLPQPPNETSSFFPFSAISSSSTPFQHCACGGSTSSWSRQIVTCAKCEIKLHEKCMRWNAALAQENKIPFLCPLCRMKALDPFFPVVDTIWTSYLHPALPKVTMIDTPEGDSAIIMTTDTWINADGLHQWRRNKKEVVVRCVILGTPPTTQVQLQHDWPRTIDIRVNENIESVFPPRPDHKRRDTPSIITPFLRPDRNHVEVVSSGLVDGKSETTAFVLGIFLCDGVDAAQLVAEIQEKSNLETLSASKERVRQLMRASTTTEDDDVACVERTQRFKLSCPITLMRMMIPARGRHCRHLQCFDLESFIQVTKGSKAFNNRWKCPECPLILRTDVLVVDKFVEDILRTAPENVDVVEVAPDGSFTLIKPTGGLTEGEGEESSEDEEASQPVVKSELRNPWGASSPISIEDINSDSDETQQTSPSFEQYPPSNVPTPSSSSPSLLNRMFPDDSRRRRPSRDVSYNFESASFPSSHAENVELIDVSPSTCSSAAATEPEDSQIEAEGRVRKRQQQQHEVEERARKRRRGASIDNSCGDRLWKRGDDDQDDDCAANGGGEGRAQGSAYWRGPSGTNNVNQCGDSTNFPSRKYRLNEPSNGCSGRSDTTLPTLSQLSSLSEVPWPPRNNDSVVLNDKIGLRSETSISPRCEFSQAGSPRLTEKISDLLPTLQESPFRAVGRNRSALRTPAPNEALEEVSSDWKELLDFVLSSSVSSLSQSCSNPQSFSSNSFQTPPPVRLLAPLAPPQPAPQCLDISSPIVVNHRQPVDLYPPLSKNSPPILFRSPPSCKGRPPNLKPGTFLYSCFERLPSPPRALEHMGGGPWSDSPLNSQHVLQRDSQPPVLVVQQRQYLGRKTPSTTSTASASPTAASIAPETFSRFFPLVCPSPTSSQDHSELEPINMPSSEKLSIMPGEAQDESDSVATSILKWLGTTDEGSEMLKLLATQSPIVDRLFPSINNTNRPSRPRLASRSPRLFRGQDPDDPWQPISLPERNSSKLRSDQEITPAAACDFLVGILNKARPMAAG